MSFPFTSRFRRRKIYNLELPKSHNSEYSEIRNFLKYIFSLLVLKPKVDDYFVFDLINIKPTQFDPN